MTRLVATGLATIIGVTVLLGSARAQSAFNSDDFNTCSGPSGQWTFVDPLGSSSFGIVGVGTADARLAIDVAAGFRADAWQQNKSARLMQACADDNFVLELKLETIPTEKYQIAGALVEQDAQNWLRFDYYSDGASLWCFTAATVGGTTSMVQRSAVTATLPLYLRVSRTGDNWTHFRSTDGQNWTLHSTFNLPLAVTAVGPFAGNAGPAPAFHAEFDYFFETSSPISPEDGNPLGAPLTLGTSSLGLGSGSIQVSPQQGTYNCGQSVTLEAFPNAGSEFTGWSGAVSSAQNPVTHIMDGDAQVFARFDPVGPPILTGIQVFPGAFGATILWETNKPATSVVDFGPTASYGTQSSSSELVLSHEIVLQGLTPTSTYHFALTSVDGGSQSSSSSDSSFQTGVSLGPDTDDFNNCAGLSSLWTTEDPKGGALITTTGVGTSDAWLRIQLPSGTKRDAWNTNTTTRIMQPADDGDFEIEVAFESILTTGYQMQGLLVEQDATNWIRFDFYTDGANTHAFAAATTQGSTVAKHRGKITHGAQLRLKLQRSQSRWTQLWSDDDGQTWNFAAIFDHTLAVSRVGIFAGTAGAAAPAFVLEADYFWQTSQSLASEDLAPTGGPFTLSSSTAGLGTGAVLIDPVQATHACGEQVTITATPDAGSVFAEWEGALQGYPNPAVLFVSDDIEAIARFDSAAPPLISNVVVSPQTTVAEISWTTDKLATSRVDYGLTAGLGQVAQSGVLTTQHSLTLYGLDDASLHHFTVTSVDWQGQPTTTSADTFTTQLSVGPSSDDFNRCEGLANFWTTVDPVGGSTVIVEDAGTSEATLRIDVPGNGDRDAWDVNNTTRIVQPADDEDFELEVSFTSIVDSAFQIQGILVEEAEDSWLRFDFFSDGARTHVFAASTTANMSTQRYNGIIPGGTALRMRVQRTDSTWKQLWSSDGGASWQLAASFAHNLEVATVGVHAGVARTGVPFTMVADYFFDLDSPVVPEDGPIDGGPFTIDIPNDGTVIIDPILTEYWCGQEVTITVVPAVGTIFSGWSGSLAGQEGSVVLRVGSDLNLLPVFVPTPAPNISGEHVATGSGSALVSWLTDLPADSMVEYGLTASYGSVANESVLIQQHEVAIFGLTPETLYHYRVTSASDSGASTTSPDGTFSTHAVGGSVSTDFREKNLDLTKWSFFQDPRGDSQLRLEGFGTSDAHLVIEVPQGVVHDVWNINDSARALQLTDDIDMDLAVRMESVMNASYQLQGMVFVGEQDDDFVRIEFYHNGQNLVAFAATTVNAVSQVRFNVPIWSGPWNGDPLYLRVQRVGDAWTVYYSFSVDDANPADAAAWTTAGSFVHATPLTAMGPYVGNAGNAPGFIGRFDWFFDLQDPIPGEDGAPPQDTHPPRIYRDSVLVLGDSAAQVTWYTDEKAWGHVQYGTTTSYELGQVQGNNQDYSQIALLSGLETETLYHYRIVADDGNQLTVGPDRTFTTTEEGNNGPAPIVTLWYATPKEDGTYHQAFGANGLAQSFCNILGNVSDTTGYVQSLQYSLNGGPMSSLSIGPDTRRLLRPGDFNVDLPITSLLEGENSVLIIAADDSGNQRLVSLAVDFTGGSVAPSPGTIDWDTVSKISDVAQVVDGKWVIQNGKLRAVEQGYDRFVAFGDYRWKDFEIEVPVTVHSVDVEGFIFPSNYPLVGFALRWPGHAESATQPSWRFWPMGALADYRWDTLSETGFCEMRGNFNGDFEKVDCLLTIGVEHKLKARVTTNPDGSTNYKFKMWPSADVEVDWVVEFTLPHGDPLDPDSNPAAGCIGLLSHHVDADFGDVTLQRLDLP